jgi:hypothetical protein
MMSIHSRRTVVRGLALISCVAFSTSGRAEALQEEPPILTISGKVSASDPEAGLTFGRAELEAMGTVSFETNTPWYKQPVKFEGVPLDKLMQKVGASGQRVIAMALNDYSTEIPIEDFAKHHAILAIKRDGAYMSIRDKGPLFIVYPYDSDPELKSQKFYSRSAWQVNRLIVK